jgi:hypothetical protein
MPCWGYDPLTFCTAAGMEVVGEESPPQPAARPATAVASMARVNERRMTADRGTHNTWLGRMYRPNYRNPG